jgi:hypothetical protein
MTVAGSIRRIGLQSAHRQHGFPRGRGFCGRRRRPNSDELERRHARGETWPSLAPLVGLKVTTLAKRLARYRASVRKERAALNDMNTTTSEDTSRFNLFLGC